MDVPTMLKRAEAGEAGGMTARDCSALRDALDDPKQQLPMYCAKLISSAQSAGILARRNSSVGRAWDMADGHGKRTIYEERVPGGTFDKPQTVTKSTAELFLESKDPATQDKIRQTVIRTASRGAHTRIPAPQEQVEAEKQREFKRRLTRRKTLQAQNNARKVVAASPWTAAWQN